MSVVHYVADGWGVGELWLERELDGELLVGHVLPRPLGPPRATTRFDHTEESATSVRRERHESVTFHPLAARLQAYFRGERVSFDDVELDLGWCTGFQRAVALALRDVPYGEVVTYGELAALAGHPNAQRAAGSFCARNRCPLVVPCHRVVAADGLGSYGSLGSEYKRRLLEVEDVAL